MSLLRVSGLVCLLLGLGSTAAGQSPGNTSPPSPASGPHADPVQSAYLDFERTGNARVIHPRGDGGFVLFPYGHTRPTMRCPLLNACVIVLDPGEGLTDEPLSGDTERWIIDTSVMGSIEQTVIVIVKPQFCDIATNLVIPTSRRIYELALVSEPCEGKGRSQPYTRQVRFWYPDEMWIARLAADAAEVELEPATTPEPDVVVTLNRAYDVERGWFLNRKRYPWIPSEVFDDGVRTYIVLPDQARHGDIPVLYMLENGERHLLNYALRGNTLVADRVLRRAVLVVGKAGGDETVEIRNRAPVLGEEGAR